MNRSNPKTNPLLDALQVITEFFNNNNIPYMIFGGIANSVYGNPRQTFDIDIKISLDPDNTTESFIRKISKVAKIMPENPLQFVSETLVLPVEIKNVRVDIVFADLPFEIEAIRRSYSLEYYGLKTRICRIEDLIIHKAISTRRKDWADIEILIYLQKDKIDWDYLQKHCEDLSNFLNRPEILREIKRFKDEK